MFGIRTFTASAFFAALTIASAATPDYFPLQQGNAWAFRSVSRVGAAGESIDVQGKETFRNQEYVRVNFFGRTVYLRQAEGVIVTFDTDAGQEKPWLDFNAEPGTELPTGIEPCTRAARVESRTARITTAAGEWDNAIQFAFVPACADAGVTTMYFVPAVGPVVYETTSIAGPVRWELVRARAASTTAEAAQLGLTVALDAPTYKAAPQLDILVRLTLRNTHTAPVALFFPSQQRYDARIWNDRGEIVYSWSANKLFAQVVSTEQLQGERTFVFTAEVPNLSPGRYVAEAWLATRFREFVGVVGFEVTR